MWYYFIYMLIYILDYYDCGRKLDLRKERILQRLQNEEITPTLCRRNVFSKNFFVFLKQPAQPRTKKKKLGKALIKVI